MVGSFDPNAKTGPAGFGISKALPINELLQYMVYFENVDSATAAAEEVAVLDTLSANMDWSSFALGDIQVGERTISVPESSRNFSTTIAVNDTTQLQVSSAIDPATGVVRWLFKGTDPRTGEFAGFLPPNKTSPEGEGHVSFTIKPKKDVSSGTRIQNRASIVFDVNPPMQTNEVGNTIDALPPSSSVKSVNYFVLPPRLHVSWTGNDDTGGSGLKSYSIFYSENGGPYTAWLSNTSVTSGEFALQGGSIYRFYSVAQDSVGNVEIQPDSSDVRIDLSTSVEENGRSIPTEFALSQNYPNPFNPITTITYQVPKRVFVSLRIYNVLGQPIKTLVNEEQPPGYYSIRWDCRDDSGRPVGNGVYIYRMVAGGFVHTKKALVLK